jgi:hypothetical protein
MSRTYRNLPYSWTYPSNILRDTFALEVPEDATLVGVKQYYGHIWYIVEYNATSKAGKKRLAKYRKDGCVHAFKEPGPSWFRNLFSTRPYRRRMKREIQRFIETDGEYEVPHIRKGKLPYWT